MEASLHMRIVISHTFSSVLTLLQIQDSFPWKIYCLKITKKIISPEPSSLNFETLIMADDAMSC